jgi:hypothetical protein
MAKLIEKAGAETGSVLAYVATVDAWRLAQNELRVRRMFEKDPSAKSWDRFCRRCPSGR